MLKHFMSQNGFYYSIIICFSLGILCRLFEWKIYKKLINEAENAGKSENRLIKQLKLKVKSCYKLNFKIQNTKAFTEAYLFKYRIMGIRLNSMKNWGAGILLICSAVGILAMLTGVYYQVDIQTLIYHGGFAMISILLLQFMELQFSGNEKRKEILVVLEDYLDNFFINRLEYKTLQKETETEKETVIKKENKQKQTEENQIDTGKGKAQVQIAATTQKKQENESEKSSKEQVIADVIREFLA